MREMPCGQVVASVSVSLLLGFKWQPRKGQTRKTECPLILMPYLKWQWLAGEDCGNSSSP